MTALTLSTSSKLDQFAANLFLTVLGAGIFLAAWLLTQDAVRRHVISDVSEAIQSDNIFMLREKTDWDSVRAAVKNDLVARELHDEKTAQALVNHYIRAENLPDALYNYHVHASHIAPADFVRDSYFSGLTEMTLVIAPPPQLDRPALYGDPAQAVFGFTLHGWRLKALYLPTHLVPHTVPHF